MDMVFSKTMNFLSGVNLPKTFSQLRLNKQNTNKHKSKHKKKPKSKNKNQNLSLPVKHLIIQK